MSAQKTDVVVLRNGDHITGEVKRLDRGQLSYSTDDMGTLSIEWEQVASLRSTSYFEVELASGGRYFGSLGEGPGPGQLVVRGEQRRILSMTSVVRVVPIELTFWERISGYVDLGFDFFRANRARNLNGGFEARYRSRKWENRLQLSSYFQKQEGAEGTSRNNLSYRLQRFLPGRWSTALVGGLSQNRELDLELRANLGAGGAYSLVRSNRAVALLAVGVQGVTEGYKGEDRAESVEAMVSAEFGAFRFNTPKLDVTSVLNAFPNLSDWGRVRVDFEARFRYELVKDFFATVTLFDNFDSRPGAHGAERNDFGWTLSLSYSF